jgi:multiple sugar transport system permease protein
LAENQTELLTGWNLLRRKKTVVNKRVFGNFFKALVIIGLSCSFIFPLYWMATTSLKGPQEVVKLPPSLWPQTPGFDNYRSVLSHPEDTPVFAWFKNSFIVASCFAVLSVSISLLAGYALSRLVVIGKKIILTLLLIAMAIPSVVLIIPSFILVDFLGWTDTLKAVIIPPLSTPFGVLLFYQYLSKFPKDLEEAAYIDGASSLRILTSIIIPTAKPVVLTLLVMNFMAGWNDYFWPFLVLYSPQMRTMAVGMATLQGRFENFYGLVTAGAAMMALPSIVLFILIQKYYVQAISLSGAIKE